MMFDGETQDCWLGCDCDACLNRGGGWRPTEAPRVITEDQDEAAARAADIAGRKQRHAAQVRKRWELAG